MLKIAKLPDRTPLKLTISVTAEQSQALHDYAALYQAAYGEAASVAELVPFMLDSFLKSDPAFAKARREGLPKPDGYQSAPPARAPKTGKHAVTSAASNVPSTSQPKEA